MEFDTAARSLGYPSAYHWLKLVEGEAMFGVAGPDRLTEYDTIFRARRAITHHEALLLAAVESGDWEWLNHAGYLNGNHLTFEASRLRWAAIDALERL